MTIRFRNCRLRRGDWALQIDDLVIKPGLTAVIGANGSGKTSLGRVIVGLDALSTGCLSIDGVTLDDPSTQTFVPAHRRRVGMVFQDLRLFGHLRVIDNAAFGLRRAGSTRSTARRKAQQALELVGLDASLWQHRPDALSGGQRQRVALARSLAIEPDTLIVDEPLASIDSTGRARLRHAIGAAAIRHTLLISHDPVDVITLAQRVLVIDRGRVASHGSLGQVTASPGCGWAAEFLGANVVTGRAEGTAVIVSDELELSIAESAAGEVIVTFPANAVTLHFERPEGSVRNVWRANLERVDVDGERARVHLGGPIDVRADITSRSASELGLRPGLRIWAAVKATEITVVS